MRIAHMKEVAEIRRDNLMTRSLQRMKHGCLSMALARWVCFLQVFQFVICLGILNFFSDAMD